PAGLGLFITYYVQFWIVLLQAHLNFKFVSTLGILSLLLQVGPSIVIAWLTRSPFLMFAWSAGISALQLLCLVWYARRRYHLGLNLQSARRARAREMSGYAGKTFLSLAVGSVLFQIDRLVLGKLAPPHGFTDY